MKFIVAVDGSTASDRAIDHAVEIANATEGTLTVAHSVDPDVYDTGGSEPISSFSDAEQRLLVESVADAETRGQRLLGDAVDRVTDRLTDGDVEVETDLLYGDPVETISAFATREGYDGIFVGHRGLSEEHERVLGSVAKGLVARSSLPVTVVR